MDQEHPHLSAHPSGSTSSPISASPETPNKPLPLHTTIDLQATSDNSMSSGTPDTGAGKDSSEPRLEDGRDDTPASDISSDDAADVQPTDDTQAISQTVDEQSFYKRELRPTRGTAPCTWMDADTTGDFDPREEARKARPRRKKAKLSHRGNNDSNGEEPTIEPFIELEPELPPLPALCLRFSSSAWKLAFSELCAKLEREVKLSCDKWTAGYQLRKRKSMSELPFLGALGVQATGVRVIASEQLCDFTNHPVARGCFDCLAIGQRCSLLDNEHSWPCDDCKINDNDCHVVKDPELKLACTHCQYLGKRKKWLVCSFEYDQDPANHLGRCVQCQEEGHRPCIAGPLPSHVPTRTRIGPDGQPYTNPASTDPKVSRKNTCRRCLDSCRACSFNTRVLHGDGDVCTACDMAGETCEPLGLGLRVPQHRDHQSPQGSAQEDVKESDMELDAKFEPSSGMPETPAVDGNSFLSLAISPDPPADPLDSEDDDVICLGSRQKTPVADRASTGGTIKTVRTKLCHPVRFDYKDSTPDGSDPCHFCACAAYSIIGLEERVTEVIEWHDGRGWEEVSGGHKCEGTNSTQVCSDCTVARMRIMVCDGHYLRRIAGVDDKDQNLQEALEMILGGDGGRTAGETWCSICCNLAVWECCSEQQVEEVDGCGLALCEPCVVDLTTCDGSLEAMLQQLEDEPCGERPLGLRADYELLKQDGLLMGFLRSSPGN